MEIKQLKTFSVIAKAESFSKASTILGYAQPTVTTHIQLLEKELNVKLFERLGHKIKLTPQGERLLYYSENILKYSAEAIADISQNKSIIKKITIGANESFSIARLPVVFKNFLSHYPEVDMSIKFGSVNESFERLKDNTIDLAFFLTKEVTSTEFITETLISEPIVMVTSPEHPFCIRRCANIKDLENQNIIVTQKNCTFRKMLDDLINQSNIQLHSIIETNNIQAIKELVASGLGITIMPLISVKKEIEQGTLIAIPWSGSTLPVCTQVCYHKNKWLSPTILNFLSETRTVFSS